MTQNKYTYKKKVSRRNPADEILVQILSYLTMKSDIYSISQISARLQKVAKDKRIEVKKKISFNTCGYI